MSSKSLADRILEAAQPRRKAGWFDNLSDEQRAVVLEVRDRWRAGTVAAGVSASQLARTMVSSMPDARLPSAKEVAAWLNRRQ
jgi:hypothetical protein